MTHLHCVVIILIVFCCAVFGKPWVVQLGWCRICKKNRGVTAAKLTKTAIQYKGSTEWSKTGCKHGSSFCGQYKSNLFVHDVLTKVKAVVPSKQLAENRPIAAKDWGNPRSFYILDTNCYVNVKIAVAGDIVAFLANRGRWHVGILTKGRKYISAGSNTIEEKSIPSRRLKTFWRYKYLKKGC